RGMRFLISRNDAEAEEGRRNAQGFRRLLFIDRQFAFVVGLRRSGLTPLACQLPQRVETSSGPPGLRRELLADGKFALMVELCRGRLAMAACGYSQGVQRVGQGQRLRSLLLLQRQGAFEVVPGGRNLPLVVERVAQVFEAVGDF